MAASEKDENSDLQHQNLSIINKVAENLSKKMETNL